MKDVRLEAIREAISNDELIRAHRLLRELDEELHPYTPQPGDLFKDRDGAVWFVDAERRHQALHSGRAVQCSYVPCNDSGSSGKRTFLCNVGKLS